ncbi:MAG: hypothetical protein MJY75_01760 [Bacteroidaceae bacterium]|nr:hypothetical protein [Bacteroidaceae bacterium]
MKTGLHRFALCAGVVVLLCSQLALFVQNIRLRVQMSGEKETDRQINVHCIQTVSDMVENSGFMASGELLSLFDSLEGNAMLVCRASEFDCGECVDYAIGKMAECVVEDSIGLPLLLLGNYSNRSALKVLLSGVGIRDRFMSLNMGRLGIPIDDHGAPYYFVLYSNGMMTDFFTPEKTDRELTDMYFSKLRYKWHESYVH